VDNDSYVFQNIGEMDMLAWRDDDINYLFSRYDVERLSYYSLYDSRRPPNPREEVSEPGVLLMLAFGFLAMGYTLRWRRNRKNDS
jgi:hypothetical protein